jgi:hypothetical protein
MASVFYNEAKRAFAAGEYDWGADDFRARLVMTNTTCDTENDGIVNIDDFTTVDVADATGYADVALASEAVTKDDANDRAELDCDNISFAGMSGGATRSYQGILVYKYVDGTDANDLVVAFVEFASTISSAASQVDVTINAEGLFQLT